MTRPIVCAFEEGRAGQDAARVAGWLASGLSAPLAIAHAFDEGALPAMDLGAFPDPVLRAQLEADQEQRARARARGALDEIAALLAPLSVTTELLEGLPVATLAEFADDRNAALLVVGTAARSGMARFLQGSVAAQLVTAVRCPTVVVPPGVAIGEPGPVVVGHDGSDHAHRSARHGAVLAAGLERELVLVTATEDDAPTDLGTGTVAELRQVGRDVLGTSSSELEVSLERRPGEAVDVLARAALERIACLLVIGTRGHGDLRTGLFGSVPLGVVRAATRPVVLVPESANDLN